MGEAQRQRLSPEARKELLLDAAEDTFAAKGYTQSGLAEIADAAGVSKTLLYHYYPDGRSELYRAVVERLTATVLELVGEVASAPVSPARRLSRLIETLLSFFEANPAAYRLVVLEPWGSGDPSVIGQAAAVRMRLTAEVAGLLAGSGSAIADIEAGASATVGAVLQIAELRGSGSLDPERARVAADAFVSGGLARLGLL
jgi:AcrR family transcriptional regulator